MNEEDIKRYRCRHGDSWGRKRDLDDAAGFGWNIRYQGLHALRQLPLGGTCTDDDGDTWERVQ